MTDWDWLVEWNFLQSEKLFLGSCKMLSVWLHQIPYVPPFHQMLLAATELPVLGSSPGVSYFLGKMLLFFTCFKGWCNCVRKACWECKDRCGEKDEKQWGKEFSLLQLLVSRFWDCFCWQSQQFNLCAGTLVDEVLFVILMYYQFVC